MGTDSSYSVHGFYRERHLFGGAFCVFWVCVWERGTGGLGQLLDWGFYTAVAFDGDIRKIRHVL